MNRIRMLVAAVGLGLAGQAAAGPAQVALFLAGAATALTVHEGGHLTVDVLLGKHVDVHGVDFLGVPFFAISPTGTLTGRERYAITCAGFLTQEATSEWLLTRRPDLRHEKGWFVKGMLAFDVATSAGYAAAAFAYAGPVERDTRGMAVGLGVDERWVGALVLAPAVLDSYRFLKPKARWAKWASRAVKLGTLALVLK